MERKCKQCGAPCLGRRRKFCSRSCGKLFHEKKKKQRYQAAAAERWKQKGGRKVEQLERRIQWKKAECQYYVDEGWLTFTQIGEVSGIGPGTVFQRLQKLPDTRMVKVWKYTEENNPIEINLYHPESIQFAIDSAPTERPDTPERYMTRPEAAAYLGVHKSSFSSSSVYKSIKPDLVIRHYGSDFHYFLQAALDNFIAERERKQAEKLHLRELARQQAEAEIEAERQRRASLREQYFTKVEAKKVGIGLNRGSLRMIVGNDIDRLQPVLQEGNAQYYSRDDVTALAESLRLKELERRERVETARLIRQREAQRELVPIRLIPRDDYRVYEAKLAKRFVDGYYRKRYENDDQKWPLYEATQKINERYMSLAADGIIKKFECPVCDQNLPYWDYYFDHTYRKEGRRTSECKSCKAIKVKKAKKQKPQPTLEERRVTARLNLHRRYRNLVAGQIKSDIARNTGVYPDLQTYEVFETLDWTIEDFIAHIESQFDENMNWLNHGRDTTKYQWQVDHIIERRDPRCQYKTINCPEFKICWSLDNLRPLEQGENIRRSNPWRKHKE